MKPWKQLQNLSTENLGILESLCIEENILHNQTIIKEGKETKYIYFIKEGQFEIIKKIYHTNNEN